jgi:hypothetical protein
VAASGARDFWAEVPKSKAEVHTDVGWAWEEVSVPVSLEGEGASQGGAVDSDAVNFHKNAIAEDHLTLHCPECGMAFFDFSDCFALWCARCDCGFCAYCQKSCRDEYNDAHAHVLSCPHNIAPNRSLFASEQTFERSQNLRRIRAVAGPRATREDAARRSAVLAAVECDLAELGIVTRRDEDGAAALVIEKAKMPRADRRAWSGRLGPTPLSDNSFSSTSAVSSSTSYERRPREAHRDDAPRCGDCATGGADVMLRRLRLS